MSNDFQEYYCKGKFMLEVNRRGFCLWEIAKNGTRRWVLDASCIEVDGTFAIGNFTKKPKRKTYGLEYRAELKKVRRK